MQARFHRAESGAGDIADLVERKVFHKVQQKHGTLWQRKLVQQLHKLSFLFLSDEQIVRADSKPNRCFGQLLPERFFTAFFSPALNTFLVSDAEEPASKLFVVKQTVDVADRADERLLHHIEACLLVVDQFKNVNIQRKLVAPEKRVPG